MKQIKGYQGFSLLEMLLVLLISSVLGSFFMPSFKHWQESLETRAFLSSLEEELYQLQQAAILSGRDSKLTVKVSDSTILCSKNDGKNFREMTLPKTLHPVKNSTIVFRAETGHVSKMPNIQLQTAQKLYIYQFQIGSSRYVCKEKSL